MPPDITAMPILRVYIDETGDRGFGPKASPLFGFCAVVVPDHHDLDLRQAIQRLRHDFGLNGSALHWVEHLRLRHHDRRRHAAKVLGTVPELKLIFALIDKANVPTHSGMRTDIAKTYNYATRMLFERLALTASHWPGGSHRAIVKVAHARGHDHMATINYIRNICPLAPSNFVVPWHLVTPSITVGGAGSYDGLQAADVYAGMLNAAITADRFGNCSPEYLLGCAHQLRRGPSGKLLNYGIKVLGDPAIITAQSWWSQVEM